MGGRGRTDGDWLRWFSLRMGCIIVRCDMLVAVSGSNACDGFFPRLAMRVAVGITHAATRTPGQAKDALPWVMHDELTLTQGSIPVGVGLTVGRYAFGVSPPSPLTSLHPSDRSSCDFKTRSVETFA